MVILWIHVVEWFLRWFTSMRCIAFMYEMVTRLCIQGWLVWWNEAMMKFNKCIEVSSCRLDMVLVFTHVSYIHVLVSCVVAFLCSRYGDSLAYCFLMEVKSHGRNYWCKFVLVFHIPINELIPYAFEAWALLWVNVLHLFNGGGVSVDSCMLLFYVV